MTTDELWELSKTLTKEANRYRRQLDAQQPRTTKEEWNAWECLEGSASMLTSAAAWMARHEEKVEVKIDGA